jgi:predicted kinase
MDWTGFSIDLARVLRSLPKIKETTAEPVLIMISGLPGTGKSYLAHKIVERLPAVIVESDHVRKTLFPKPTYAGSESVWVHRVAHATIERLLRSGRRVIYDATNLAEWHREKVYRIAERAGAKLVIVKTVAPEPVIQERLEKRARKRDKVGFSDATWEIYEQLKRNVDRIRRPYLMVDTTRDINRAITRILRAAR